MSHPACHQPEEKVAPKKQRRPITLWQSIGMGSLAGAVEVTIDHPLWSVKTRLQRGDPFTLNPSILYRGILSNASSMVPVTAIQVTLNRCVHRFVFQDSHTLSDAQKISAAFVAGIGSSFVSCPTEMIMTQQSKTGATVKEAILSLKHQGGCRYLWTGLPATGMREGVFTAFFLAVTPILKQKIASQSVSDYTASLTAGIGAGIGAAVISQCADTVKTRQQTTGMGIREAIRTLYITKGVRGFFRGGLARGLNVVSAVTIMGLVNEKIEASLHQQNQDDHLEAERNMQLVKK